MQENKFGNFVLTPKGIHFFSHAEKDFIAFLAQGGKLTERSDSHSFTAYLPKKIENLGEENLKILLTSPSDESQSILNEEIGILQLIWQYGLLDIPFLETKILEKPYDLAISNKGKNFFTPGQINIIQCLCEGTVSRGEIAEKLVISESTVNSHKDRIYAEMFFFDERVTEDRAEVIVDQQLYVFIKLIEHHFIYIRPKDFPKYEFSSDGEQSHLVLSFTGRTRDIFSPTEKRIIECFLCGLTDTTELAEHNYISESTLMNHIHSIFNKSGMPVKPNGERRNKTELMVRLIEMGIVTTVPVFEDRENN